MYTVITQEGNGTNLSNFHRWFVGEPPETDEYAIYVQYVVKITDEEPHEIINFYQILGQYQTEDRAEEVLRDLNNSILAGETGFRMPKQ